MFRLTQYLKELINPTPLKPVRSLPGPIVIWNLIRRCNLTCKHCYSISADKDFPGELSTKEVFHVMDDLKAFGVPVLILSGGEPLLHPDIFAIAQRAKAMGFYLSLSSNGTLINEANIEAIVKVGFDYVGISLDGTPATHDQFRRCQGAFEKALQGVRWCQLYGIKVGIRFTLTQDNVDELPQMWQLIEDENIDKFYLSHLNYAGRGNKNRRDDVRHQMTRQAMDFLIENNWQRLQAGETREIVTGNNDADGVYLLLWVKHHFPDKFEHLQAKLAQWGGNSSGVNIANIDNLGQVHPDTFWWHYSLGQVRERPFSEIWMDTTEPLMAGLKQRPRPLKGRCGQCHYQAICGGNTRTRAYQLTGDPWAEDPACYLTDAEIGIFDDKEAIS
jgi:Fe-coproporphyrin III synthase